MKWTLPLFLIILLVGSAEGTRFAKAKKGTTKSARKRQNPGGKKARKKWKKRHPKRVPVPLSAPALIPRPPTPGLIPRSPTPGLIPRPPTPGLIPRPPTPVLIPQPPTPVLIPQPPPTPVLIPQPEPPSEPKSSPVSSCIPTMGPCVSTFDELLIAFADVTANDVIALCGDISTLSEPVVRADNLTICCEDHSQPCSLTAVGNHRNLVTEGASIRLQGITFRDGAPLDNSDIDSSICGANVVIDAGHLVIDGAGACTIENCKFLNGSCPGFKYGGNLFIRSLTGSVRLERSDFWNGHADFGGGALVNASLVEVTDCVFANNSGTALVTVSSRSGPFDPSLDLQVESSAFYDNFGSRGGGILASGIGKLPKLSVVNCLFERNVASDNGGVMEALFPETKNVDVTLLDNSGEDNVSLGSEPHTCNGFSLILGAAYKCLGVDEDFSPV